MVSGDNKDPRGFNRRSLWLQYAVSFVFVFVSYFILWVLNIFVFHFHIRDEKALRRQFKRIIRDNPGPLLICPNHLTYVDSPIIQLSLASPWTYLTKFYSYPWNLPKKANVNTRWFFRIMCYLGKCVLLPDRKAVEEGRVAMDKIKYLLQKGQYVLLFPEGTRSESGRVNNQDFGYGVGQLLMHVPQAKVLCIYMRGDHQEGKSNFPVKREKTSIALKLIEPTTEQKGLRGGRDLSRQIVQTISHMEQAYFAARAQPQQ